jgi:hypothetical protein
MGVRRSDHLAWVEARGSYGKTDALTQTERQLEGLAGAIEQGRVNREHAVRRLEQVARETGLTLEQTAA